MKFKFEIFIIILLIVIVIIVLSKNIKCMASNKSVNYRLTIEPAWNINRYVNQPENFNIPNIVVTTHTNNFTLFDVGKLASPGLSNYTENNNINNYIQELRNTPEIKDVYKLGELTTAKDNSVNVHLDENTNFIGIVANIYNNYGLFAGINVGLNKRDFLKREIIVPLVLYNVLHSGAVVVSEEQYLYWREVNPIGYLRIKQI